MGVVGNSPRDRARLAWLLLVVLWAFPAAAQDPFAPDAGDGNGQPFDVTADSVEFESARGLYVARGNVRIQQPERTLTADWVAFSNQTRQGVATGNVVVVEGGDTLYADVLHFQLDDLKGIVLDGRLDARGSEFVMTGEEVRKVGEQTYLFEGASFTTCRCPADETEPWVIRAEEADLEFGGYATARNTTLDILGVPVLWLPWMRYPLKTDRETGFLFPNFSASSRTGLDIGIPFFWAARDNVNVIIEPHYLFEKGFKPEGTVEYVFGERSYGELYGTWIDDKDIDPDDPSTPFDPNRWAAEWLHDQDLPRGFRFAVESRFVSDNLYPFDFRDFSRYRYDRYLESIAFLERRFGLLGRYGFDASLRYADDLANPDDLDRDDFLVHRMPDLRFSGIPQPIALDDRLWSSFDLRYTHFWAIEDAQDVYPGATVVDDIFLDTGIDAIPNEEERDQFGRVVTEDTVELSDGRVFTTADYLAAFPTAPPLSLDGSADDFPGPEGDGTFQEGEPLADRGHRVILNPRLLYPFRVADVVEVLPELGWYGTFYSTDAQSGEVRNLFTALVDVRSRLRRVIQIPGIGRAVHLLEPRFSWTGITDAGQDDNPLFVPRPFVLQRRLRQLDPWNIVRDPSDRIESVNAITLGVGNRIYLPAAEEGVPPTLFADVSFSFQEDFESEELRSLYADGTLFPFANVTSRFIFGYDLFETRLAEVMLQTAWADEAGNNVALTYRYIRDIPRFFESFRFDDERFEDFEEGFLRINQLDFFTRIAITRNWGVTYRLRYSFEESLFLANQVGVEYISRCLCWALRLEVEDDRSRGLEFQVRYRIIGLGADAVRPFQSRGRRRSDDPLLEGT